MSYAAVAAKNAPPESEQPQPSQDLLEGHFEGETPVTHQIDEGSKVSVVTPEDLTRPRSPLPPTNSATSSIDLLPSIHNPPPDETDPMTSSSAPPPAPKPNKKDVHLPNEEPNPQSREEAQAEESVKELEGKAAELEDKGKEYLKKGKKEFGILKKKAAHELEEAESFVSKYFEQSKEIVLRPGVLGGLLGVVNVGILGTLGYFAYTRKDVPWNRNYVGAAVAGTLSLFAGESVLATSYAKSEEGQAEIARAKEEGSHVYLHAKEIILRPGVLGGVVGVFNLAVLGTVGWFGYKNWNKPSWDRRLVSGVTAGLIGLSAAEGVLGNVYRKNELPKQKKKGNA